MSMQDSWGQGTTQTPSSSVQPPPIQPTSDVSFTPLACTPFDVLLSAPPLSASSNIGDLRRPSAKAPHPNEVLKCPRCESLDTKFCYYNNYSLTQPRYFCKNCKRYWTAGGALRNVPVGGGLRKNKRSKLKLAAAAAAVDAEGARAAQQVSEGCMQPLGDQSKFVAVSSQILDNRTASLPASGAMPSHALVPEIPRLYSLPSGEMCSMNRQTGELIAAASHCNAENAIDQNGASATAPVLSSQAGNFYVKEEVSTGITFFCDPNQVPQFYSNYTASMSMPFGTTIVPCSSLPGYSVNNFFTADPSRDTSNDKCDATTIDELAGIGTAAMDTSTGEVKQEKDVTQGPVNTYDWQLISDGLFNGSDSSNFLYTPSSSWPDFTQFNDTGPG